MDNEKKQEVIMNKPSTETMMRVYRVYHFLMRTSVPRILAAIDRGELVWENGELVRVKEASENDTAARS
jgi:hypothetical protein